MTPEYDTGNNTGHGTGCGTGHGTGNGVENDTEHGATTQHEIRHRTLYGVANNEYM